MADTVSIDKVTDLRYVKVRVEWSGVECCQYLYLLCSAAEFLQTRTLETQTTLVLHSTADAIALRSKQTVGTQHHSS